MVVALDNLWIPVRDGDARVRALQRRHYSYHRYRDNRRTYKIVGPGEYLILLTLDCKALFGWQFSTVERRDKQEGVYCFIFRNEGSHLSSELILQAEDMAQRKWGNRRFFTYINSTKIKSTNPGYCFLQAGWQKQGISGNGLVILEKVPEKSEEF